LLSLNVFVVVNIENSYVVYAFLVDALGYVRWQAGGVPNEADTINLALSIDLINKAEAALSEEEKRRRKRVIEEREKAKRERIEADD
jgi:hypothetical protein